MDPAGPAAAADPPGPVTAGATTGEDADPPHAVNATSSQPTDRLLMALIFVRGAAAISTFARRRARLWATLARMTNGASDDPAAVATRFYERFQQRDGDGMAALYSDSASFSDPAFPDLHGEMVGRIWRMLTRRGRDLTLTFEPPVAEGPWQRVAWTATYTFAATGKKVVNHVVGRLRIENGRIVEHRDTFDFPTWAAQAFGVVGKLLGGTGFFQRFVQGKAAKGLAEFR